jgi:hypothetical protein
MEEKQLRRLIVVPIIAGALFSVGAAAMATTGFDIPGIAKATGQIGTVTQSTGSGFIVGAVYPSHSNDCDITFSNPNSVAIVIDTMVGAGAVVTSGPSAGTNLTPAQFAPYGTVNPQSGLNIQIPANGSKEAVIGNCVTASSTLDSSTQGTTFTLHFTTDGHSA